VCTAEDGSAALLRPGSAPSVIRLRPQPGLPYPSNFAAGARAIVVTYTQGLGGLHLRRYCGHLATRSHRARNASNRRPGVLDALRRRLPRRIGRAE